MVSRLASIGCWHGILPATSSRAGTHHIETKELGVIKRVASGQVRTRRGGADAPPTPTAHAESEKVTIFAIKNHRNRPTPNNSSGLRLIPKPSTLRPCDCRCCPAPIWSALKITLPSNRPGDRWHVGAISPQEVADIKATALQRLAEPDRQAWPGDLFTLRLVATIEAATIEAATPATIAPGHAFDYVEFGERLNQIYASATGGKVFGAD